MMTRHEKESVRVEEQDPQRLVVSVIRNCLGLTPSCFACRLTA